MASKIGVPKNGNSFNFTDRAYLFFFALVSLLLMVRSGRIELAWAYVVINLGICAVIALLSTRGRTSRVANFLHDWYPLPLFILCFEEVSRLSFLLRDAWQDHYLLALEERLFAVPPTVWLGRHGSWVMTEFLELGYFSYFVLLFIVGGVFYATKRRRAFRQVMDATVLSYLLCYTMFIVFPTEGPAHTLAAQHNFPFPGGGPFHWAVQLIQRNAGVHGNAFPSAHVAGAMVSLYFAWRYVPRLGLVLTPIVLLLCVGAVYDRYHYLSDVIAGAIFGLGPAFLVARGWVGTRFVESEESAHSPALAAERYTQNR